MRVPPQRSSRSNTASTTPGKRLSSTSANASSNKKRKLATDAPPSSRTKKHDAKKKQLSSKQQVKKVSSPTAAAKLLKAVTSAKKTQLNKHKIVPLVGLKKIKIKEGRVTIKKILMTTGGAKAQKKQAKLVAKATVGAKKQLNVAGGKKMTGAAAAVESQPTSSTSEDQMAGSSCDSEKKSSAKLSAKKVKGVKKPKGPSTSVAIPLTRTKKLQQRQKLKKITVQRVPVTRKIMITQKISSGGGKKKVATRRKQGNEDAKGGTAEENIPTLIVKGSRSPSRESEGVEAVHTGGHIISVVLQSSKATSTKKAKEDEGAIKKKNKGKPKMEDVAKGYEPTKDKSEMPKKEGKPSAKKQQKVKLPTAKSKAAKKSPVVKSLQVISKKLPLSPKASPKATAKKTQQPKKKLLSKKVSPKEEPSDDYESRNEDEQKSPASNDGDSSTSDEITLDVLLLRQQQMKQEVLSGAEQNPCSTDKPSLPLVKTEGSCSSRSVTAAGSPLSINTSDDEDLKSIKNRIKVKLENDSESEDRRSKKKTKSGQYGRVVIKKEVMTPEKDSDSKSSSGKQVARKALGVKKTPRTGMKRSRSDKSTGSGSDTEQRARRMKLFGFWSGPKRHRVASLNALAKVHCLYENEGRGAFLGICASGGNSLQRTPKPSAAAAARSQQSTNVQATTLASTRTLRSAPGMRGMGKHWDMHNASSTTSSSTSSDDTDDSNSDSPETPPTMPPSFKQKKQQQQKLSVKQKQVNKVVKRRRKRNELMMDLKDMVVRKRMASLNASAILAASYSFEKRPAKTKEETNEGESSSGNVQQGKKKKKKRLSKKVVEVEDDSSSVSSDLEVEECDLEGRGGGSGQSVIEVRGRGPNSNKKVAVIVNQDTDVTITGVYVNSTTRSTHHEGFCSIAGMQYRISSTSHTQTEATAVATETVLHTSTAAEHPPAEPPLAPPMKSYTPLGALSNMQPPGSGVVGGPPPPPPPPHHHHHHPHPHAPPPCTVPPPPQQPPPHRPGPVNPGGQPISPLGRRHGCSSAFSAPPPPPGGTYGPQPPHHHPPPQGQTDPAYIHGYYQPAGPLISTHHHHHSASSSSSITNSGGKVLPTLEASPTPTPPPSAASSGSVPPPPTSSASGVAPPQQIVSVTSSGGESSDNDVIITATSCSGGGEVAPPVPPAGYRYPQSYPPPPTPSTPQHLHHQAYSYNYPHTQYYPSPPASASIQYSAVATNPQHHAHYHNQDLCYSSTANYPPASYFHHKSYSTPPPASYHRRYIPPPHPAQYYSTSDLYSNPASNVSQPNSNQSQQSQQMVVTGSGTGSVSSYQPPPAPPPPPLVGVSSNPPPPPPLVETYPPPVSIVDPYAGAPAYYGSYGAGPGPTGCYTHSPPTRSLAFIDAAYQSCPCPMQSCPKNVHTGPLTGDGKGPSHIASKQQQQQQPPVQESGASFHQLPLPPVALALPLEPPGALGPPSPARGSAGMPPPPSPATASARNPSQCQEEAAFQQRSWDSSNAESLSTLDGKILVKSKQEPSGQDYVGETHLFASLSVAQDLQLKGDTETTSEEAISRHGLLTISKVSNSDPGCRAKSRKNSPPASNIVPLLMCKIQNSDGPMTKLEEMPILDSNIMNSSVKTEVRNMEKETLVEKKSAGVIQNGSKTVFRNGSSRKRKDVSGNEVAKMETEVSVPKRRKLSTSNVVTSKLSSFDPDSQKTNGTFDSEDQLSETQTKCKSAQPLSSNSCSLHNAKQNVRKRKLDDGKDLAENKEPVPVPVKKKQIKVQTKIYPSRAKPVKNVASSESLKKIDEVLESVVRTNTETLFPVKKSDAPVIKKAPGNKMAERKKETKINGVLLHQKKPLLRHQSVKNHEESSGDSAKARASQTNVNHVRVEGKKAQHCKKSDVLLPLEESSISGKKSRVNHMLRSHGLRDSLSDRSSSDDAESNIPRGKVGSCSSSALTNRRVSTGSRKEQIKKPLNTIMRNDHSTKKQLHIQGTQELASSYARKPAPRKSLQSPKWSNGWKFEGEPFESKVFTAIDDMPVMRKCYPLMRHQEGDVICPRDCVLLKSGPRKTDLPFVAKVASLWENPDDGEMMVSLLWYYRPEHTDQGRREDDMEDEIFASKHKDINSVACIEDKCYVLTFNEYCRYRKGVRRLEDGIEEPGLVVPQHEDYPRENRQPPGYVAPELVFFCRRVYDFRQRRILKNPG